MLHVSRAICALCFKNSDTKRDLKKPIVYHISGGGAFFKILGPSDFHISSFFTSLGFVY